MKRNAILLAVELLPLLAAWAVTFTENAHIADGDATYEGEPVTVSGCTLTVDGAHVFTNLVLVNSATLTHTAGSAGMTLTVSGTVSVATGSKIDVSERGLDYLPGTSGNSGGSHGGRGQEYNGTSCPTYGDVFCPTNLGSGGYGTASLIRRGGGMLRITADLLELDGELRANGTPGYYLQTSQSTAVYRGGGSGGSILLEVGTLSGSGSISANGGDLNSFGRSGGGGRVAVYYDDASGFSLDTIQAAGGVNAGAGTVYLKDRDEPLGTLVLDNRDTDSDAAIPTPLSVGSNRVGRLLVSGKTRLNLTATEPLSLAQTFITNATIQFTGDVAGPALVLRDSTWEHAGGFGYNNRVTLSGASVLCHAAGSASGLRIECETVEVASGSRIDVSERGLDYLSGTTGYSGGSHGGRGQEYGGTSCATYGDAFCPTNLGSGGNGSASTVRRGGGMLRITADTLELDGELRANGTPGYYYQTSSSTAVYRGGGSGGSILLEIGTLSGFGSISANGGNQNSFGRSGGGGRVAVFFDDASGFDLDAIQAAGGVNAGAGTVYLKGNAEPLGTLVLYNRDTTTDAAIPTPLSVGSNRFDRLRVGGGVRLDLAAEEPLTLAETTVTNAIVAFTGDVSSPDLWLCDGQWTLAGAFGYTRNVTLLGTSRLTHGEVDAEGLQINALTVTVSSASAISVNGKGSTVRSGTTGRSGGSYGGRGQDHSGVSGPVYGDAFLPTDLGAGGAGNYGTVRGGGRLQITADVLHLDGTLRANGDPAIYFNGPYQSYYRGAGSGGSILVEVGTLAGDGLIQANGGARPSTSVGLGGGGRVAVYARDASGFSPAGVEAKAETGGEWGTVVLGVPRTVAVTCTGQGVCEPAGPVVVTYGGTNTFAFTPTPVSLATNGTNIAAATTFEWVNTGLWRGTLADSAWLEKLNGSDTLEAVFEALTAGQAAGLPGGGMAVTVNGLAGWRYTLERRESLTEGEWTPVPGQVNILCGGSGPLILTDAAVLPQAFYRVVSEAP